MPIGFDRLLYPIAKKLKWHHPDFYGPAKLATILGALQTEMVMLGCLGDWLQGSGWTIALSNSGVTTSGNNSLLSGHGLAATKFVHEVTACTLYDLMKQAYQQSKCDTGRKQRYLAFEQWREQMELLTLNFIFGQFHLRCKWIIYCSCTQPDLKSLVCTYIHFFVHYNCAWWMSVQHYGMGMLKESNSFIFHEF